MRRSTAWLTAIVAVFWISGSTVTKAAASDVEAIRSVIEGQIAAFRADDGATAYSFAAPGIRRIFPTPEVFMQMVRQGYRPVYRPRSYHFEPLRRDEGVIIQDVAITGPDGGSWTARYTLQKLENGEWKIAGCQLMRVTGAAV